MKPLPLLLAVLLFGIGTSCTDRTDRHQKALEELDRIIERRDAYGRTKNLRIAARRDELAAAKDPRKRIALAEEIYKEYGRYLNKVDSFEFPGLTGMEKMASIMQKLRDNPPAELAGHKVVKVTDYKKPEETGLPAANVLIYSLENGATVVVRPSGTEPKIKTYFTTLGKDLAEAQAQKDALAAAIEPILK